MIDIAAIITVHNEAIMAGPTMRSAEAAIVKAEEAGFTVERLIGFDSPTPEASDYFNQDFFSNWKKSFHKFKDQGLLRNVLAKETSARWIAFLDADDLWSENWLTEAAQALAAAEKEKRKIIVHPELNWFFENQAAILAKTGQEDPSFLPHYFYFSNYYDALCMAPAEAHVAFPYATRDIKGGFAYEDWQWNLETMAAGWCHHVAKDTIIFKRRRENSQTIQASRRKVLVRDMDIMNIENINKLGKFTQS